MTQRAQGLLVAVVFLMMAAASFAPPELKRVLAQTLAVSWICGMLALSLYFVEWESRP